MQLVFDWAIIRNIADWICNVSYGRLSQRQIAFLGPLEWRNLFGQKSKDVNYEKLAQRSVVLFCFCSFYWMPFYIAGVYRKGQTFPEILVPNSLLLHTKVLKNKFLFSGTFCKGNIPHLTHCDIYANLEELKITSWHLSLRSRMSLKYFRRVHRVPYVGVQKT